MALRPQAVETRRNLAIVLAILGRIDDAAPHHRRLPVDPALSAWALTRLALLRPSAITDADLAAMRRLAGSAETDVEAHIGLRFGLGEALELRRRRGGVCGVRGGSRSARP